MVRVSALSSTGGPSGLELGHIATYRYHGFSRHHETLLGDIDCPTFGSMHTLRDQRVLSRYGQLLDRLVEGIDCTTGTWDTVSPRHAALYDHDEAGKRLFARIRQTDVSGAGDRDNSRSQLYDYDVFGRLTNTVVAH